MTMNLGTARATAGAVNWFKWEWLTGGTMVRIWPPDQLLRLNGQSWEETSVSSTLQNQSFPFHLHGHSLFISVLSYLFLCLGQRLFAGSPYSAFLNPHPLTNPSILQTAAKMSSIKFRSASLVFYLKFFNCFPLPAGQNPNSLVCHTRPFICGSYK